MSPEPAAAGGSVGHAEPVTPDIPNLPPNSEVGSNHRCSATRGSTGTQEMPVSSRVGGTGGTARATSAGPTEVLQAQIFPVSAKGSMR